MSASRSEVEQAFPELGEFFSGMDDMRAAVAAAAAVVREADPEKRAEFVTGIQGISQEMRACVDAIDRAIAELQPG
jgi:hypothetical protein